MCPPSKTPQFLHCLFRHFEFSHIYDQNDWQGGFKDGEGRTSYLSLFVLRERRRLGNVFRHTGLMRLPRTYVVAGWGRSSGRGVQPGEPAVDRLSADGS